MDTECMDHYEKQLYTVFKTFDVDNEEALSKTAVLDLCNALQLEERGAALVETLFERAPGAPADRVTFAHFRNGLLSVLGAQPSPSSTTRPAQPPGIHHSDDESSSREVEPKFVFGSKKYGRRSRPPATLSRVDLPPQDIRSPVPDRAAMTNRASREDSELAAAIEDNSPTSTSADLDHDRLIDYEQSLSLCKNLNMDGIDSRVIQNIYRESSVNEMTVGEFFDRLNTSLTLSIASTCDGTDIMEDTIVDTDSEDCTEPEGAVSSETIVESWERAGVEQARRLLVELCGGGRPRPSLVQRALDLRLRSSAAQPRLYLAATSLARLRASAARRLARAVTARADKLRADLADANRRAHQLAQEVDENHARIEASLKTRLKQAEARHVEASRAAELEWANERDRLAANVARLESFSVRGVSEEARLRAELAAAIGARDEAARLAALAEDRARQAEESRALLARRFAERTPESRAEPEPPPLPPLEPLLRDLDVLRAENKSLRDRNDELCALLEAAGRAGVAGEPDRPLVSTTCWQDEIGDSKTVDEADQSFASIDQKVVSHIDVVKRLQEVLDNVTQVSLKEDNGCESCATLKSIITSIQDKVYELSDSVIFTEPSEIKMNLSIDTGVQTDEAEYDVDKLNQQLAESYEKHRIEKEKLTDSVKQLESSLEQLKAEYDKCEDYWTQKLEDEREMYNEEQRLSDERLSDLFSKISEYEQQFAPKSTSQLPTIDEKCSLEVQFNDLDEEYQKYKNDTETQLASKDKEIDDLKLKIKELENRNASIVNGHSNASSPIDYLWNHQGTIQSPFKTEKRDYQNPAFKQCSESIEGNVRCSSDSERDKLSVNPIQRPLLAARSSSAHALGTDDADGPQMINCSELEGQLRQQAQGVPPSCAVCMCLQARCRQLAAAARHRQICLETVQHHTQAAMSENGVLRAKLAAAEGTVTGLQSRLAAADLLVKELFLENCQLAHRQTRLL